MPEIFRGAPQDSRGAWIARHWTNWPRRCFDIAHRYFFKIKKLFFLKNFNVHEARIPGLFEKSSTFFTPTTTRTADGTPTNEQNIIRQFRMSRTEEKRKLGFTFLWFIYILTVSKVFFKYPISLTEFPRDDCARHCKINLQNFLCTRGHFSQNECLIYGRINGSDQAPFSQLDTIQKFTLLHSDSFLGLDFLLIMFLSPWKYVQQF